MRLLNARDFSLHEFTAEDIPRYAILSHTWGHPNDEVLYKDIEAHTAEQKAAFSKINYACTQTLMHNLEWLWIDTCCIDKSSSSELSEAINSMYDWYHDATTCYVFMDDVEDTSPSQFANSRWFTRGWTLQELIAPASVIFFSKTWTKIGEKSTKYTHIARITGIEEAILTGQVTLASTSIAKRMYWACKRRTTRPEDIAYCLMGLFNVNLPMLYGEGGEKAFIRLQEEIMKYSDDQSLFAWRETQRSSTDERYSGLLARRPSDFEGSGDIVPYRDWELRAPYSMTNRGLRVDLHLTPLETKDEYVAALYCPVPPRYEDFLGIYLKRLSSEDSQYARIKSTSFCQIKGRGTRQTIYVRQKTVIPDVRDIYPYHVIHLREGPSEAAGYRLVFAKPSSGNQLVKPLEPARARSWAGKGPIAWKLAKGVSVPSVTLTFERSMDGSRVDIVLGSTLDFGFGFDVEDGSDDVDVKQYPREWGTSPSKPGQNVNISSHDVRVNAEPVVYNGTKFWMVDISISPTDDGFLPKLVNDLKSMPIIGEISNSITSISADKKSSSTLKYLRKLK